MASPDIENANNLPELLARRTLLIGLGTTGARACSQIMERLTWAYDTPDNVPWVRCLILETAEILPEIQAARDYARCLHLKIDRKDYHNLINNPQNYDDLMDFSAWNIPELTNSGNAIEDGANNVRLLGRLAFLFPSNFSRVKTEITNVLAKLKALNEQEATQRFAQASAEKARVSLGSDIYVYVVGSLCGGTSSGCFIDLGYLLQNLVGYGNLLKLTGVFMLPSSEESNAYLTANAFAALVELNHFSSKRSRYRQKLPDGSNTDDIPSGTRPYHFPYLIQARGAAPEEYAKLVTAAADYIYSDVVGGTAGVRDTRRTNIQTLFMQKDVWGAPQQFCTFGIASLEFPYTKVLKACSLKLTMTGFREINSGQDLTQGQLNAQMAQVKLLAMDALMQRLLHRESDTLDAVIEEAIQNVFQDALNNKDALELLREQLESPFRGNSQSITLAELPINCIPLTIEANARALEQDLRRDIRDSALRCLSEHPTPGLQTLISYLKALKQALETSLEQSREARSGSDMPALLSEADEAQEQARDCREDLWLRLVCGTKPAVRRYVNQCLDSLKYYYSLRLRVECAPVCERLYGAALEYVNVILSRIENTRCGFAKEVHDVLDRMQDFYARTDVRYGMALDSSSRVINGEELFEPGVTIEKEYKLCLLETAEQQNLPGSPEDIERRLARQSVREWLNDAAEDLFAAPHSARRFDPALSPEPPRHNDTDLLRIALAARSPFAPLKRRSVIERLLTEYRTKLPILMKKVNEESRLLLNWMANHARHRDAINKRYQFIFFNTRDPRADEFQDAIDRADVRDDLSGCSYASDPHQIMILRERGAFSLGVIRDLLDESPSQWRREYNNRTIASYHSRGDVKEWITWGRDDEDKRNDIRNLFLVACALNIIEFQGGMQYVFRYIPQSPADPGQIRLSADLDMATQSIRAANIAAQIGQKIRTYRQDNGPADMYRHIDDFTKSSDGKFTEAGRRLSIQEVDAYLIDYVRQDVDLREAMQRRYPDQALLQLLREDKEGRMAYHCPAECGKNLVLAYRAADLYGEQTKDGRPTVGLRCPYYPDCKVDLAHPSTAYVRDGTAAANAATS